MNPSPFSDQNMIDAKSKAITLNLIKAKKMFFLWSQIKSLKGEG